MVGFVVCQLGGAEDFAPLAVYPVCEKNQVPGGAALFVPGIQHWEAQGGPKLKPYTVALEDF